MQVKGKKMKWSEVTKCGVIYIQDKTSCFASQTIFLHEASFLACCELAFLSRWLLFVHVTWNFHDILANTFASNLKERLHVKRTHALGKRYKQTFKKGGMRVVPMPRIYNPLVCLLVAVCVVVFSISSNWVHCLFLLIKLGCPHCKKMKPEFSKAAKEVNTENAIDGALGAVDCTTARELCSKQEVKGYPTREYSVLLSSHGERSRQFPLSSLTY